MGQISKGLPSAGVGSGKVMGHGPPVPRRGPGCATPAVGWRSEPARRCQRGPLATRPRSSSVARPTGSGAGPGSQLYGAYARSASWTCFRTASRSRPPPRGLSAARPARRRRRGPGRPRTPQVGPGGDPTRDSRGLAIPRSDCGRGAKVGHTAAGLYPTDHLDRTSRDSNPYGPGIAAGVLQLSVDGSLLTLVSSASAWPVEGTGEHPTLAGLEVDAERLHRKMKPRLPPAAVSVAPPATDSLLDRRSQHPPRGGASAETRPSMLGSSLRRCHPRRSCRLYAEWRRIATATQMRHAPNVPVRGSA